MLDNIDFTRLFCRVCRLHISQSASTRLRVHGLAIDGDGGHGVGVQTLHIATQEGIDGIGGLYGGDPILTSLLLQQPLSHLGNLFLVIGTDALQGFNNHHLGGNLVVQP